MAEGVSIGTAWVTLAVESKGIQRDVRKAGEDAGDAFNEGVEKKTKDTGKGLDSFGTKALVAAAAVGAGFYGLASAAGSLSAALSTADRVFGEASDTVATFAADTTDAVFLSETATLQAANSFGIFGTQAGMAKDEAADFGVRMVQMAADLAAVADVPVSQAVQDMTSAFAGSTETMQKYGINLNETELKAAYFAETGEKITGVMTSQQKTMAVYWALLEKGSFAYGAAESEADQFASQVDRIKGLAGNVAADFGAPLVGFAENLLDAAGTGLEGLIAFNDETGGMLATGIGASLGIAGIAAGLAGGASKLRGAADWFTGLNKNWKIGIGAMGGLALAVTAGFTAYGLLTEQSRVLARETKAAGEAMGEATREAWEYAGAAEAAGRSMDGAAIARNALGRAFLEGSEELTLETIGSLGISVDELGDTMMKLSTNSRETLTGLATDLGLPVEEAEVLAEVLMNNGYTADQLSEQFGVFAGELYKTDYAMGLSNEAAQKLAEKLFPLTGSLEDVWDAASGANFAEIAAQFLNTAAASGGLSEELILQAEHNSEATRAQGNSVIVLKELMEMLKLMTPEERAAAEAALGLADATDVAADSTSGLESVAGSTVKVMGDVADRFDRAASEAKAFDDALAALLDPSLNLQQSWDDLTAGADELRDAINKAKEGEEGYSLSLNQGTEDGRTNRDMIRGRITDIQSMVNAELKAGSAVADINELYGYQYDQLVAQVAAFTGSEAAAEEYLATLGLTPDSVSTAIEARNLDITKTRVEGLLAQYDNVPPELATSITAAPDLESLRKAEQDLRNWAYSLNLQARIQSNLGPAGSRSSGTRALAYGGYVEGNNPHLAWVGDASWDEAMVTVGNPANLRQQLQDDRIRQPIMDALDLEPVSASRGGSRSSGAPMQFISYEQNPSPAAVAQALEWSMVGR